MSSILERIRCEETGLIKPDWTTFSAKLTAEETSAPPKFNGFTNCAQHRLTLGVWVEFYANPAQYRDAYRTAEKHLLSKLHRDILCHLSELSSAVSDHDEMRAHHVIDQIKKDIGI